ncbi:Golgi-associated plant pathogenesis-related protein 1-like [Oppia nitens]|uniref:Golgi-associated plant pathogenesis-related protein 1-like n=1 Tax=Oppia nitens TaxID=1686743 RepID=UPI0023D99BD9|nr:Golgi-associated plant pathogenesis-related protein 1-like [Oppia nitens]
MIIIIRGLSRHPLPDETDSDFQNDCLNSSNNYRQYHESPDFVLDQSLVDYAKSRCQTISQNEGTLSHDGLDKGIGENLAWMCKWGSKMCTGQQAVDMWYAEEKHYNYSDPKYSPKTGHFTQLVWKDTVHVGCARCFGRGPRGNETYIVCNYKPRGNIVGYKNVFFRRNVLDPEY